jgi:WD40 repeat protein
MIFHERSQSIPLAVACWATVALTTSRADVTYRYIEFDTDQILAVAYSPDGRWLAGGGFGKAINLWDARTGKVVHRLEAATRPAYRSIAFSPDGKMLVGCGDDGVVRLWNVRTGELERSVAVSTKQAWIVSRIAFSPDGTKLAAASRFKQDRQFSEVSLLDLKTGKPQWTWAAPGDKWVYSVAFAPDGKTLAASDGQIHLLNAATGAPVKTLGLDGKFTMLAVFSPDGKTLVGAGGEFRKAPRSELQGTEGHLLVWDARSGELIHKLVDLPNRLMCVAFSPGGEYLATGSDGPTLSEGNRSWLSSEVQLWNPTTGKRIRTYPGEASFTHSVAFSPDGKSLLSCDSERVTLTETLTGLRRLELMKTTATPVARK